MFSNMRFLFACLVCLGQIFGAFSVTFTNPDFNTIVCREPFNISWEGASGSVMIMLRGSSPGVLDARTPEELPFLWTIDSQLPGTNYIWNVPVTLPSSTLALEIQDDNGSKSFSPMFGVAKATENSTASTTTTSTETSPTSPPSTTFSTSTQQTSLPSSTTNPPLTPQANPVRNLTAAAKVGIAIGSFIGFLIVLSALFLVFRYGKKYVLRGGSRGRAELGTGEEGNEKVELGDTGILEAEGSEPISEKEQKIMEVIKEEERRKRANFLEGKSWKKPVVTG